MANNDRKQGVSVKEIENFTRKHRFEVFFCLAFIFACFFSFVFFGAAWAVIGGAAGGILGVLGAARVEHFGKAAFHFVFKQEATTQLVLGIVALILSIFLPPVIFFLLGLHGGKSMHHLAMEIHGSHRK